jgi:hypothetical protein
MEFLVETRLSGWRLRAKDAVINALGWTLNRVHSPARMKPFEYVDPDTDETIYLYTDKRLSVLLRPDYRKV